MGNETKAAKRAAQAEKDRLMDEKLRKDFYDPDKRKRHRRNVLIGWCITLAIVLMASLINWGVITGWGNVTIDRLKLSGSDGAEYSGLVYRPANATDDNPAPAVICIHGNAGNGRNHESWAMEFARRGFVVISPDIYGSGDSQGYFDGGEMGYISKEALIDEPEMFYQYLLSLPYVDTDNIISTGHSMGCVAARVLGAKYDAKMVIAASPGGGGVDGPFAGGDQSYPEAWHNYHGNYAILRGDVEVTGNYNRIPVPEEEGPQLLAELYGEGVYDDFEVGKVYGSFEDGNAFVYEVEDQRIHEAAFVSTTTVGNLLEYAQLAVGDDVPNYIDSSDQVWPIKDYTGLFGIFAWAAFVFATALLLIEEVPAFAAVRRPLARNVGFRGPGLAIAMLIGVLAPYLVIKTDAFGIVGGGSYTNLKAMGFNLGFSNMGFGVVVGLTLVCILGGIVYVLSERKKKSLAPVDFGIIPAGYEEKTTRKQRVLSIAEMILKSALVAAIAVAVGFGYTQLQLSVLGTDFYAWFFGVKDIPLSKIPNYLNYLAVFIICFLFLSIDMNVIRRLPTTGNETKDVIIAMIVNVLVGATMVIIIVAVKWYLQSIGSPADTNWLWGMGLDTQRIWGLPVGMTVASAGSTFIYKKTGNLWLCALLVGTIACIMGVLYGGTRFHYLTFYC